MISDFDSIFELGNSTIKKLSWKRFLYHISLDKHIRKEFNILKVMKYFKYFVQVFFFSITELIIGHISAIYIHVFSFIFVKVINPFFYPSIG